MKHRPKALTVLALALFATAVSFPLQIVVLHEHSILDPISIASKVAPLNWVVMALSIISGLAALRASRLSLVLMPALVGLVSWNNWLVATSDLNRDSIAVSFGAACSTLLFGALASLISWEDAKRAISDPSSRWWMTATRWRVRIPVRIRILTEGRPEFATSTFDISSTGVFVPARDFTRQELLEFLKPGTQCLLALRLGNRNYIHCRARIVRNVEEARGGYPRGFGVQFIDLNPWERLTLISIVKVLFGVRPA